jgi:hypothetical protein
MKLQLKSIALNLALSIGVFSATIPFIACEDEGCMQSVRTGPSCTVYYTDSQGRQHAVSSNYPGEEVFIPCGVTVQ